MRICHVTPHLPPEHAANALLPVHLGRWSVSAGCEVAYVAHPAPVDPARHTARPDLPGPVTWAPQSRRDAGLGHALKLDALARFASIGKLAGPLIESCDLVHLHSNGLLVEACAWLAARKRKPTVLTLYGTEIWHYQPRRLFDPFTRAYRRAAHVTFYSQGLLNHAIQAGLARREVSVIYPPVAEEFLREPMSTQEAREALGLHHRHVLVNVKRLHPLAGQRYLLQAMGEVIRWFPDTRLVICGTGSTLGELKRVARAAGVEGHVTFAGLVDNQTIATYDAAADLFVLPSLLEACPTVALESLACGTPVVSSDNPGGVELSDLFGIDVAIVPREDDTALASAIIDGLETKRRVRPDTRRTLHRDFSLDAVARQFFDVYEKVLRGGATPNEVAAT